jgi:O-antigen ligase
VNWAATGTSPSSRARRRSARPRTAVSGAVSNGRALAGVGVMLFAGLVTLCFMLSPDMPLAPVLPFVVFIMILGAGVLVKAGAGSRGAVMILLAAIVFLSDAQLRARGAGDTDADWQSLLKVAIWMAAGLVGVVWLPPARQILGRPGSALILAYVATALVSALYAPSFAYSFGGALSVGALYAFGFTLTRTLSIEQILWTTVLALALFLAIGWAVFIVNPELGASPFWTVNGMYDRFCGISGQADNMGSTCAKYIGALFLLWRMGGCRLRSAVPLAALGFASLVASDARTGMISLAAGVGAVMLPRTRWGLFGGATVVLLILMVSLGSPANLDGITKSFSRSGDPSELYTLTGRLEIWNFAEEKVLESPIVGYGYNSSKVILGQHLGFENGLMVDTAHNLWLQNMLSVGLIGTLPMAALFVWLAIQYVRRPCDFRDFFAVSAFVAGMADNQAFGTTPTVMMALFFVASLLPDPVPVRSLARLELVPAAGKPIALPPAASPAAGPDAAPA